MFEYSPIYIYLVNIGFCISLACILFCLRKSVESFLGKWIVAGTQDANKTNRQELFFIASLVFVVTFLGLFICNFNLIIISAVSLAAAMICPIIIRKKRWQKFLKQFDLSLVESLTSMATSLKAGLTLKASLETAVASGPEIFAAEAGEALKHYHFGESLEDSLNIIRARVNTQNTNIAFGAMVIGSRLGGNLPNLLSRIVNTIRERERVEGKLMALTAQGRTQAYLLGAAPIGFAIMMYFWDPEKIRLLTHTLQGNFLLGIAITLEICGIVITKRIMQLDI